MATKKTTARKAPAKKPAPKKQPVKKAPAKKTSSRAAATKSTSAFLETRFTEQTVYWLIIGVAVIALAAWVLALQVQLNEMYDAIDATTSYVAPEKPAL